ncbi:MAG: ABC transporter ATP-binding protein [Gemmatimonadetes bacterium]|nr:ABC transporter ATP-binding protein [Gemmatimonadota bacterium]MYK53183.1 ABC transporter ATP-binding protein [Gemmatimonadota bacterium]
MNYVPGKPLIEKLPPSVARKLGAAKSNGETVLIQVGTDLDESLNYNPQWVVVTDQQVLVIPESGVDGTQSMAIGDVEDVKVEERVGLGALALTHKAGPEMHVPYSPSLTAVFAEVADGIRQLKDNEPLTLPTELEQTQCEHCGKRLPEKNGVCAACLKKWQTFRRIVGYMAAYPVRLVTTIALTFISALFTLLPPKITEYVIDGVLTTGWDAVAIPFIESTDRLDRLGLLILGLVIIRLLIWGVDVVMAALSRSLGLRAIGDLREDLYRAFQMVPVRFYDRRKVGALTSRMNNDTDRMEVIMTYDFYFVFSNSLLFVGILGFLAWMNWQLTLFVVAPIPLIVLAGTRIWYRIMTFWTQWSGKWGRLSAQLNESIHGIRVVKAFAQEAKESERFDQYNEDLRDVDTRGERAWFVFWTVTNLFMNVGVFFVWYFGGRQILGGELTLGALIAFMSYLWMLYQPLRWFGDFYSYILRAFAGAQRVFEVIDSEPEPYQKPDAVRLPKIEGHLEFESVFFGYDPGKPVLKGVDLEVKAGEMIGLVGKSGAGKSTLINLVCRFYDPDRGRLLVDGVPMTDVNLRDLRSQIGMVHQQPFLFDGTIAENIAYGKPDATFDEVMRAAIAAEAHEFIVKKPDGYDMRVGESGGRLSGGEKQRVSIARAILHNPRILILDEATSSLDTPTEKKIQMAIARLVEGRTTFAIAHRLSTLRSADRLVVMDEGNIAEVGTHRELMDREGIFYRLVKTQQETTLDMFMTAVGIELE